MFDPLVPHGWHRYWKAVELPPLTDDAIDTLVEHASAITSPRSYCIVFQLGGALARVGEDETAFSQRQAAHNVNNQRGLDRGRPQARTAHRLGPRLLRRAAAPRERARVSQLPRRRGPDRVRAAYGRLAYERLVRLKRVHDPADFFRLNQNIQPG
jgi:hypothetical protein